jgi:hypothetical protein
MRVALLTTATTHHDYYARQVAAALPLAAIFVETGALRAPFETSHPFERERDAYETQALLGGRPIALGEVAPTRSFESMNDPAAVAALGALELDVTLVFGTGRLGAPVIEAARLACLNLHGGDPEEYRGLDTHLWAIYHRDFEGLVTTLHHVDLGLDTGDVVARTRLQLRPAMPLAALRAVNTAACVRMTLEALQTLERTGALPRTPLGRRGRYYSFMPAVLKDVCVRAFARHTGAP